MDLLNLHITFQFLFTFSPEITRMNQHLEACALAFPQPEAMESATFPEGID